MSSNSSAAAPGPPSKAPAIVLYTSTPTTPLLESHQRDLFTLLSTKKIGTEQIDGANAANKELRSALWAISGKRAVYPQLFRRLPPGGPKEFEFIGDWETIFSWLEANDITHELDERLKPLHAVELHSSSAAGGDDCE